MHKNTMRTSILKETRIYDSRLSMNSVDRTVISDVSEVV
jgi:hypothetical protein